MELLQSLLDLVLAFWNVIEALVWMLIPWSPLFAWIAFWTFAVNWTNLRSVLLKGGWIGLLLIGLVWVLVWGSVAPPVGKHEIFGLSLSNYVGKVVYVTMLYCIMFLCGSVQLSGALGSCCTPKEEELIADKQAH